MRRSAWICWPAFDASLALLILSASGVSAIDSDSLDWAVSRSSSTFQIALGCLDSSGSCC